ncbi:hypothetical protein D9M68_498470 [compost metagenome]
MGRGAEHRVGAGFDDGMADGDLGARGRGLQVLAPVHGHQHHVGLLARGGDARRERSAPCRRVVERQPGRAGALRGGGEARLRGVEREQRHAQPAGLPEGGAQRRVEIRPGAGKSDGGGIQQPVLLQQRLGAVVAAVVVGRGDHVDAGLGQHRQHLGPRTVVIRAAFVLLDALLARGGDHAFEVHDAQVGLAQRGDVAEHAGGAAEVVHAVVLAPAQVDVAAPQHDALGTAQCGRLGRGLRELRALLLRLARLEQAVVGHVARQVVLHVVDAHAEAVVLDEERARDAVGVAEEHRQLGPEVAVGEITRAVLQRAVELVAVQTRKQRTQRRVGFEPQHHLARGHHELEQRGEGGDALQHEVQVARHVLQAELVVARLGLEARELVDAVAQPVVVRAPVARGNEMLEGLLDHREPARVAREAVQPHEPEGRFAVVVNDAVGLLHVEPRVVEHVHEAAGLGVLHGADAQRQLLHQRLVLRIAGELGVLHQRQQAHGVAAELDLVADVDQERGLRAVGQRGAADQPLAQEGQRAIDGGFLRVAARELPAFEHGVGGAGVAQRVVGGDRAVEAREPAVVELARGLDLLGQVVARRIDQRAHLRRVPVGERAKARGLPFGRERPRALGIDVHGARGEAPHGRGVVGGKVALVAEAALGVRAQVAVVGLRVVDRAVVEHGAAVHLLREQRGLEARVERDAFVEVVALGLRQPRLQFAPGHGRGALDDLRAQPLRGPLGALRLHRQRLGRGLPRGLGVGAAAHDHAGAAFALAHREEHHAAGLVGGGRGRGQRPVRGGQGLPGAVQQIGEGDGSLVSHAPRMMTGPGVACHCGNPGRVRRGSGLGVEHRAAHGRQSPSAR